VYSEASQAVLGPNRPHLVVRSEFATGGGGFREAERGALLVGKNNRRLLVARKMKYDAGNVVLRFRRQGSRGFNGLFEKFCHAASVAFPLYPWKGFRGSLLHVISAQRKPLWIKGFFHEHES
jgi:hypothetical protein